MIIDVRSPGEYDHAHIPGAINLPLLDNAERHVVGICYKERGFEEAYLLGLQKVGPKMSTLLQQARSYNAPLTLYCARGGMRSGSLGFLFSQGGIKVTILPGGYKAYRQVVLEAFLQPYTLKIVSGTTGSGKTEYLQKLRAEGEQVLDLEALANHRGSAFGQMGRQPSNEQFENEIYEKLRHFQLDRPIWVEDESRLIGTCAIPHAFFATMKKSERHLLTCSEEERIERLLQIYAPRSEEEIQLRKAQLLTLQKRIGLERVREALRALDAGDFRATLLLLLPYYDRTYKGGCP